MPKHDKYYDDEFEPYIDEYADYAAEHDPDYDHAHHYGKRKKRQHTSKKSRDEIINDLADDAGLAAGFETTYQPSRYETGWLLQSVETFYYQDLMTDVLSKVKGGKEASVYRCRAHDTLDIEHLAAKVYRPRQFRELSNDALYREGRRAIDADGKELNEKDWRALKAMNKGTGYGQALAHTSWLMYEYNTLRTLYDLGASVPRPIAVGENAILMSYFGDDHLPAPALNEVQLPADEAAPLFERVLHNIELMLREGIIHGDLSAYNILYWAGDIVLIDFPQVVNIDTNHNARAIFARDIQRVCEYFTEMGITADAGAITAQLWSAYGTSDADPDEMIFNRENRFDLDAVPDSDGEADADYM